MKPLILSALAGIALVATTSLASDLGTKQGQAAPAQAVSGQKSYLQTDTDSSAAAMKKTAKMNHRKHQKNNSSEKSKLEESQTKN
jgi:hypothetical protein